MDIVSIYVAKSLILPPAINFLCCLIGAWCYRRRHKLMTTLFVVVGLLSLVLCCTPWFATLLARDLERLQVFEAASDEEAIVVLGGGTYNGAPEYFGDDTLAAHTLERLRYAWHLQRRTSLPLAVVGGSVFGDGQSEGVLMQDIIVQEWGGRVDWVEQASRNTAENAINARREFPFTRIVLVTHALHMRRARHMFEQVGFKVTPAPMGFVADSALSFGIFDWLPSVGALAVVRDVLHERFGLLWYRWRYAS